MRTRTVSLQKNDANQAHRGQLLLRSLSIELCNDEGDEIEFEVKRTLNIKEPSKAATERAPAAPNARPSQPKFPEFVSILQIQADMESQRQDISRIDTNGFKIATDLDKRMARIEDEAKKLGSTFSDLRRDITGTQEDLTSLKNEIKGIKGSVKDADSPTDFEERLGAVTSTLGELRQEIATWGTQLRQEISDIKSEVQDNKHAVDELRAEMGTMISRQEHDNSTTTIHAELAYLKQQINDMQPGDGARTGALFPSRELEILSSNISRIGSRTSQVESLQMDFELLKGRVERMETNRRAPGHQRPVHVTQPRNPFSYSQVYPQGRKRAPPATDFASGLGSAAKRAALSPGPLNSPVSTEDRGSEMSEELHDFPRKAQFHNHEDVHRRSKLTTESIDKRAQHAPRSVIQSSDGAEPSSPRQN